LLYFCPGAGGIANDPATFFSDNELSLTELHNIERGAKGYYEYISPIIAMGQTAKYKNKSYYSSLVSSYVDFFPMYNVPLESGRYFTEQDRSSKQKVAVIGSYVKDKLFKEIDPIEKKITLGDTQFLVIGVIEEKSEDFNKMIIIPDTTMDQVFDYSQYTYISASVPDGISIDDAKREIQLAMLKSMDDDEFTIFTQEDFLETFNSIIGIIEIALIAISSISLIVGGIGIMNIMLVSVTERIKEIGLRRALGATSGNIAFQFMTESILVSILGGILGLLVGACATIIAQRWIQAEIKPGTIALALGFSIAVGVLFGTYPAVKASKLDPIEALRYE
jgi:putative ABC transport system permease protein